MRVRFWLASAIKSIIQSIRTRPNRNRRRQMRKRFAVRASAALLAVAATIPYSQVTAVGQCDEPLFLAQPFAAGDAPVSVTTGDFDGDGVTDMATANQISDNVSVLLNQCVLLGDVNQDGTVSLLDVQPFVDLLTTGGFQAEADINQDGDVTLLDVNPFVHLLTGG